MWAGSFWSFVATSFRDPLHLHISVTAVIIIAGAFCILQSHLILSCLVSPVLYVLPMHADARTMPPFAGWSGSRSGLQSCVVLTCSPMMWHHERTGFGSAVQIGIPTDTISSLPFDCIHDVFDFSSITIHNICNSAHCLNFLSDLPLTSRHACIVDRLIDHIHECLVIPCCMIWENVTICGWKAVTCCVFHIPSSCISPSFLPFPIYYRNRTVSSLFS